jgi:Leucine-rich repeat (LRR) protein
MASPFPRAAWLSLVLLLLAAPRVAPASASEAPALSRAPAPAGPSLHDKARARSASERERATRSAGSGASSDASAVRFTAEGEARFSRRLASALQRPCEGYARNLIDEPARDVQHAAVIALRESCAAAPPAVPGQTVNACADLANAVNVVLDHAEAAQLLKQLLHEKCQAAAAAAAAAGGGARDAARARDAASFLVADTVRRVAEDEQTLRDHYGAPGSRSEVATRPRVPEEGVFLLSDRGGADAADAADANPREPSASARRDERWRRGETPEWEACDAGDASQPTATCAADERLERHQPHQAEASDVSGDARDGNARPAAPTTWRYSGPSAEDAAFDPLPEASTDPESLEEIRRVERVALTDLYRGAEGSRWRRQRNWLSRKTHCAWEGVFCASDDAPAGVLGLVLNDNGLSGSLPQTLARLRRLRHLDVRHNALTGEIGGAFGSLRGLTSFLVRGNALRGELPSELGAATRMERLDVSDNKLTGVVPDAAFGRFLHLKLFNVSHNGLEGALPASVCALPELEAFSASRNRFASGLGRAAAALAGPAFGLGRKIRLFDVSHNALAEPPPLLPRHAAALAVWDMSGNPIAGAFGEDFALPPTLKVFAARCSEKTPSVTGSLPESFFPADAQLRRLDVSGCGLDGALPDSLMTLAHALEVNVSGNAFTGRIPSDGVVDLRAMRSLREFDASRNALSGPFPTELTSLATLRVLDLSRNALTGPLPAGDRLANLASLSKLDVSRNQMSGPVPLALASLRRLRFLDLSANRFEGAIPPGLLTGRSLEHLDVSGNDLDWSSLTEGGG